MPLVVVSDQTCTQRATTRRAELFASAERFLGRGVPRTGCARRVATFAKGSLLLLGLALNACAGGSSNGGQDGGCDGSCAHQAIAASEVSQVIGRGVLAARARGVSATFAVVDRVGNVLAVYEMPGARRETRIDGQIGAVGGLEGAVVPSTLAAVSKAGTGAYLSSQGQAFSTRTASLIIQEHFYPQERRQPGGPLFGVQFSQLPCGDVLKRGAGPRPLPLGLSADPGGIPLYKLGDVVGGVGVEFDGRYTLDRNVFDRDADPEEEIALAAAFGFEAPQNRRADAIIVGGKALRYVDAEGVRDDPLTAGDGQEVSPSGYVSIPGFFTGAVRGGVTFGSPESGVASTVRIGIPAAILVQQGETSRPGSSLPGGVQLTAREVDALLDSALLTAQRARAAIRNPLDSPARVSMWVVDHLGVPLGFARSQDAPVFGIDVALQKARTAAFFSSPDASSILQRAGFGGYVSAARSFVGRDPFTGVAFSCRGIGNISRPFFIDGIDGNPNGPLSLPFPGSGNAAGRTWSPFNTGLQLDVSLTAVVAPLSGTIPASCAAAPIGTRLGNGVQIFPGGVPLYRNGVLIGGLGISGDGVDQDDLIAYFGASREGLTFAGHPGVGDPVLGFQAPQSIRSDTVSGPFPDSRLRYVNCPEAPFIEDNDQNVCPG